MRDTSYPVIFTRKKVASSFSCVSVEWFIHWKDNNLDAVWMYQVFQAFLKRAQRRTQRENLFRNIHQPIAQTYCNIMMLLMRTRNWKREFFSGLSGSLTFLHGRERISYAWLHNFPCLKMLQTFCGIFFSFNNPQYNVGK